MVQFKSLYLVLKHFHHLKRLLLLLLSRFSRVRLCATRKTAAHQAPRPWDSPGKNTGVGCHFLLQCMKVKMKSPSRVWLLANPMDCSLPGSSIHGIFHARVLEWAAIAFSPQKTIQCLLSSNSPFPPSPSVLDNHQSAFSMGYLTCIFHIKRIV